ncbi:MAG: tetratricopeptide repeat protein [Vicinamibacterales bacterium]
MAGNRRRFSYPSACAVALLATIATYANHFHNDFHFDDSHTILNNVFVRSVRNIPLYFTSPATFSSLPSNQSYRPVVTATLAIDYWLAGGLNTFAFHVTSFVLFLTLCALLVAFYRQVMNRSRPDEDHRWLALLAALWYALHPANAETVNYIIARSEILSTLGVVVGLLLFARGGAARRYHLYLIPAALAVLSKESGAMFAPLLFLYVAFFERGFSLRDMLARRAMVATLRSTWSAFLVCGATVGLGMRLATTYSPGGTSAWHYLLTQPFVLLHYMISLLLPIHLSADTQWPLVMSPLDLRVVVGVAFIAAALALAWATARRRETRPIAFGLLWFFVALLPTSSVVPLAEPMNDHRMFFPFVGLILAAVWAGGLAFRLLAPRARAAAAVVVAAVLVAMACGTWQRNSVWRSEESLWLDATIKSPDNGRGLMNYGVIQMGRGNYPAADQYFERALQLTPRYAYLQVNIAILKAALGHPDEAERHFREALRDDPNNPVSYTYFARWLQSIGRTEEARLLAERATQLSPADADAMALVADLQTSHPASNSAEAEPHTPEEWLSLGLAQCKARRYEACIRSSERALQLRPDSAEAFNNICAAENALGNYGSATDACEHALAIQPGYALARNNLAVAKAQGAK